MMKKIFLFMGLLLGVFFYQHPAAVAEQFYCIQFASFLTRARAQIQYEEIVASFDDEQPDALRIEYVDHYYTVRAGRYHEYKTAGAYLEKFQNLYPQAIILKARYLPERIVLAHPAPNPSEISIPYANNTPANARTLKSASAIDYPPFTLVRPDGSADGFSVELLKAVVQEIGMEVLISVGPWPEIKQQLTEGLLDVLPLVAHTPERDKIYDFTAPYLQMHGAFFVRKGEKSIRTEADLKGKEVLVVRDDDFHEYAVGQNLPVKLILTATFEEAMQLLSSGKHDAVLCPYLTGLHLIKRMNIANVVIMSSEHERILELNGRAVSEYEQKFCIAVPEGSKELLASLNEGLAIILANGTYDRLYNKWFGPILPRPSGSPTRFIKYLFFTLLPILFLGTIVGVWYLKLDVARKTQNLRKEIEERKKLIAELQKALDEIKTLRGILPICSFCKNIRNDEGLYEKIESYIHNHSGVDFSHTVCPDCLKKHYPKEYERMGSTKNK
jgi:ABC-type amino acid transport substrate-binding protein